MYMLLFVREGSIRKYTLYMKQNQLSLIVVLKKLCFLPLAAASSSAGPDSSMELT